MTFPNSASNWRASAKCLDKCGDGKYFSLHSTRVDLGKLFTIAFDYLFWSVSLFSATEEINSVCQRDCGVVLQLLAALFSSSVFVSCFHLNNLYCLSLFSEASFFYYAQSAEKSFTCTFLLSLFHSKVSWEYLLAETLHLFSLLSTFSVRYFSTYNSQSFEKPI